MSTYDMPENPPLSGNDEDEREGSDLLPLH